MKKYFTLIIFSLLFFSSDIHSQWYAQYISSGNFINDIRFINRNTGWACGSNLILKTTNGGTEWIQQNGHGYLTQIHPVNDSVGYVCGEYIIMKTTNGGDNWIVLKEGPSQIPIIYGLWFNNENTGWFCGDRVALRTTNGGLSFIDSMFVDGILNDVYFKNDSVGNIAGWGRMHRTTNAGTTWYPVVLPSSLQTPFTERVTFIGDTGWTVSWGKIVFKTINYGVTWDSITRIQFNSNDRAYSIEFSSVLIGYAGGDGGKIFKTTDGGYNWQINFQFSGPFTSIYAFNDSIIWAVGGTGSRYIMNTLNGGLTNMEENYSNILYEYQLHQNYPNPFNPKTIIYYQLSMFDFVSLKVYNSLGNEVAVLVNEKQNSGNYKIEFDGSNLSSGVYFYKLSTNNFSETRKMILIK